MTLRSIALLLLSCLTVAPALSAADKNPDVVVVSLDTFRADRLERWGGAKEVAPNLNTLAAKGTAFLDCFTEAPLTLPAHATLLTGDFTARTGLHDNGVGTLSKEVPTLASFFAARGYRTQAVVASAVLGSRFGLARGFQRYDDGLGPTGTRTAAEVTDRALAALRAAGEAPLFLWVHYYDTHEPYEAPEAYGARFPGRPYQAAAAYVDAEAGRLIKALRPGTLVAVVSDHGESLGEHGEPTHGSLLFQPTMHTVCFLAGPGVPRDASCTAPVCLADVAPTLVRLALGRDATYACDGVDLMALADSKEAAPRALPLETWLPFDQFRWSPLLGITDGRYKWIRGPSDRLYDLEVDPGETKDLSQAPPARALALKGRLAVMPVTSPVEGEIDASLAGLGYLAAPQGSLAGHAWPDPQLMTPVLQLVGQGRLNRAMGSPEAAVRYFKQAVDKDPGNPTAWFEYGETLRRTGDQAGATSALDKALALAPRLPEAWTARGHIYVATSKPAEAARCYEKALALDPGSVSALNPLAAYYLDQNQPDRAIPLLSRAVGAGFADSGTYLLQGRVHLVQGKREEADKDFSAALQVTTNPARTLKEEADVFMVRSLFPDALRLYDEGMRRYPRYAPNFLTVATYFLQADKPEKALPLYRKALQCDLDGATRQHVEGIVKEAEGALAEQP